MSNRGDIISPLRVGSPAHGGACVARLDGMAIFVYGTLPGELIKAEVFEKRSKLWFARTAEVIEASEHRVPHIWPLAAETGVGGADLGHVSLPIQYLWKAEVVMEQLRRIAHVDYEITVEPAPMDVRLDGLGYRSRIEFVANGDGRLGMHIPWSNHIVPVDSMPLVDPKIASIEPWKYKFSPGDRVSLVHASGTDSGQPEKIVAIRNGRDVVYSKQFVIGRQGEVKSPEQPRGEPKVWEEVRAYGETYDYRVDAAGFWQIHREAPAMLLKVVLDAVGYIGGATVFDLFCGSGLFTAPLAAAGAKSVWAVEGDPSAASNTRYNSYIYKNVRVSIGDVAKVLASNALPSRADVVVLDPPRAGAGRKVVDEVVARSPERIVYVACDPAALARDLAWIVVRGYSITEVRAFDFFPHTHHVECVAVLDRR